MYSLFLIDSILQNLYENKELLKTLFPELYLNITESKFQGRVIYLYINAI